MNHFMEVAKMRAARMLWAKLVKQFNPSNPKSMSLRTHCQTSGYSLTEQAPYNNIARTCLEALAAAMGGTQSLHTNALDEAIALPTDFSARIARNTQLHLQKEAGITHAIDPYAGSFYVERLTRELAEKGWAHLKEIEDLGGMARAIEEGVPKMRIEEAAARKQARVDAGRELVVGVNCFYPEEDEPLETREVDNTKVRETQLQKIEKVKEKRNDAEVESALNALENVAREGEGNLLEAAVDAALKRATVGEISGAMEKVFGRYEARIRTISGVYSSEAMNDRTFQKAMDLTRDFEEQEGRRPRIMLAKMGQDGHDRGAKVIASSFADMGFDVDIGPLFQSPGEAVKQAIENDVHILGLSSLAGAHKTLIGEVMEHLKKEGREDILVIAGGVIPKKDHRDLHEMGVKEVFGPGTKLSDAAVRVLKVLTGESGGF